MGQGAVFVWEGVVGYIDLAAIDRSLRFMVRAGGAGTRLVIYGEGSFEPDSPARVVTQAGFTRFEEVGLDEVWRRYLPSEPHPNAWVSKIGTALV